MARPNRGCRFKRSDWRRTFRNDVGRPRSKNHKYNFANRTKQADLKQGIDDLQQSVSKTDASPMVKLKEAMNDLKQALEPILLIIADVVSAFAGFISAHPVLAAAITAITVAIGILVGICAALAPVIFWPHQGL